MATNRHADTGTRNGEERRAVARWLVAGAGFVWLLTSAWRRRRHRSVRHAELLPALPCVADSPRKGYEVRDVNASWIFGIVIFLFVAGLAIHFLLAGALSWLKHTPPPTDRWRHSQEASRVFSSPSYPLLQIAPPLDLEALRARENAELSS